MMSRIALLTFLALVTCVHTVHGEEPTNRPRRLPFDPTFQRVHDPSTIIREGNRYWTFYTGPGVPSLYSDDLTHWHHGPAVFPESPAWVQDVVAGHRGYFWAPDVIQLDDRYFVYYSVSAFGKNTSAIAVASSPTLDPAQPTHAWTDHGIVVRTNETSDHNAIDPSVCLTVDGELWMAYGSFWSGLKLVQLDPTTGLRIASNPTVYVLAHQDQIEAAALIQHGDYFYLFLNWGWCCRGINSTYNIRVGRSKNITGPYVDQAGIDLRNKGGTLVLETAENRIGPGHAGLVQRDNQWWLSYHYYDGNKRGQPRLGLHELTWSDDGWPTLLDFHPTSPAPSHSITVRSPADLQQLLAYRETHLPIVSAHRGGAGDRLPENCLATFQATIDAGFAMIEVDPRYTADGQIVLHHDATLDRTTTGSGKVADRTLTELRSLKLKDAKGDVTGYTIPTLDEALIWARGRSVLILDDKGVSVETRVEKIEQHRAEANAILIVYSLNDAKACYAKNPDIMMEVMITSDEQFQAFADSGVPWQNIIAFVGHQIPPNRELCDKIHAQGARCIVGTSRNLDRKLIDNEVSDVHVLADDYRQLRELGADLIETDIPRQLSEVLAPAASRMPQPIQFLDHSP
jgi:arabinan endo-1,5-alpha-L-arabinosidase